ncbi:retinin [Bactrocera oleae]|uniref:retinin n=1 Tax=Bactrocera oleae TaxID=104688 RepID=UPI0006B77C62|nr:retinin [Bactrocera oleae]XP_036221347.1 retinin [Bactrocera oleae]XP_036221353.1 retinin [Bactrocera oleae]
MFKLLPLLLSTCIVCSVASPEPDGLYNIISSGSGVAIKPSQTISLTAKYPQQSQQQLQSNAVTSGEDEENNDVTGPATRERESVAPASVTAIANSAPVSGTIAPASSSLARLKAVASAGSASASASASRSSLRVSSSIKLPSGSSSTAAVQHHILPAETLPLPITISTRPGLRTVIAPETITIHEPTLAKVGEVVQKIPTAVSHQSQTVVHKHARVVTPIVAPAVRTITSQVLRAYHTPLIFAPETTVLRSGNAKASASASASVTSNANTASSSVNYKYKQ